MLNIGWNEIMIKINTKLFIVAIFAVFSINISISAQQVNKVLISGLGGAHDENVKTAFLLGYASHNGTNFTGSVDLYYDGSASAQSSFIHANSEGYEVIVRSMTGLTSVINEAPNYPNITAFMPAGSNSFIKVFSGNVEDSPVIITGAGDENNETGYYVEFFSIDPITIEPDYSSFSNGYIAGQLCYLANELNKTIDEVRPSARSTGSNGGTYDEFDGFGQIEVETALSALPVELVSFSADLSENSVVLSWETATEVNNFGFNVECRIENGETELKDDGGWAIKGFVQGYGTTNSPKSYTFTDNDLMQNNKVSYRLKQIDNDGTFSYSKVVNVDLSTITNVDDKINYTFALEQNYPNPFNPTTTINFTLPQNNRVSLRVYNIIGEEIAELINKEIAAGKHQIKFDAGELTSGIYIYKLNAGKYSSIKKMMLVK